MKESFKLQIFSVVVVTVFMNLLSFGINYFWEDDGRIVLSSYPKMKLYEITVENYSGETLSGLKVMMRNNIKLDDIKTNYPLIIHKLDNQNSMSNKMIIEFSGIVPSRAGKIYIFNISENDMESIELIKDGNINKLITVVDDSLAKPIFYKRTALIFIVTFVIIFGYMYFLNNKFNNNIRRIEDEKERLANELDTAKKELCNIRYEIGSIKEYTKNKS